MLSLEADELPIHSLLVQVGSKPQLTALKKVVLILCLLYWHGLNPLGLGVAKTYGAQTATRSH